ncbi:hypothetical protein AX15_004108 [Amanita polypyramis BW_CC]|nr:hypothetical protein AX15_004108 [Amanita polypyramis BW_CC]
MTLLHACIFRRDWQSFQRLLNGRSTNQAQGLLLGGTSALGSVVGENDLADLKSRGACAGNSAGGYLGSMTVAVTVTDPALAFRNPGQVRSSPHKHRLDNISGDVSGFVGRREGGASSGSGSSGGGGGGTTTTTAVSVNVHVNVNDKDNQGRTALHLACSIPDCIEYVRVLLKHPSVNVNVPDAESHYTPLHRAIYVANLPAVLLLLQRPDIDLALKDYEGYTAFDLYNSTVEGTKPDTNDLDAELFMWGTNVNATLGFSDGNNRSHPDQIVIQPKDYVSFPEPGPTLRDRLSPIRVRQVGMSKLHTVVVTSESTGNAGGGNLRMCGFGSGGRSVLNVPSLSCLTYS